MLLSVAMTLRLMNVIKLSAKLLDRVDLYHKFSRIKKEIMMPYLQQAIINSLYYMTSFLIVHYEVFISSARNFLSYEEIFLIFV